MAEKQSAKTSQDINPDEGRPNYPQPSIMKSIGVGFSKAFGMGMAGKDAAALEERKRKMDAALRAAQKGTE